ncbi:MAG: hypothetical protein B6D72_02125 [gamma proteobacterium symbiont of Ctena orbiculata]|nr:thermonuclease family protein [Candidatus Thiodiazotropha taylori]PUB88444.1 MAG: hypothetical protein DBP00_05850 [gamma proteobacterium symbiont of Ctena orbiculata]PVV15515.1 MAG: hypothetical protein B6D72_02125 [gamma proteobacterium symbiont of Ctena orbiculata]PVV15836.1 MAG: hypothetical protein B6D82_02585 [gamma proteobacterium symbiont of Ctena orbiculata]PVV24927.1 MAG: hypothetical protein B6D74_04280 [gamma proteobacterium symbiont of Ctena orbiculata]
MNAKLFMLGILPMLFSSTGWCGELTIPVENILVEDGDTLVVELPDGRQRVQLIDIDAPEDSDNAKFKVDMRRTGLDYDTLYSLGAMATQHLGGLIDGGERFILRYEPERRDRYGRLIGDLMDEDGVSMSERMVANGYAIVMPRAAAGSAHPYHALQRNAQKEMQGLWGLLPRQAHLWAGASFSR